jgi:hypothetical protein
MSWIFAGVVDLMYTGTPSDGSLLQIDFVQQGVDSANGRGVAKPDFLSPAAEIAKAGRQSALKCSPGPQAKADQI